MALTFTPEELEYLRSQRLGRLATVDSAGAPQANPVGFLLDEATGQIVVGGMAMAKTRKFRNIGHDPKVAFVVDDIVSTDPWQVRGVEIRGEAEALTDADPPRPGMSRELIRITPTWIGSWGIDPSRLGLHGRGD
jgi:pyridoxamine 5'-phosphate oxidase family protein